MKQIRDKYQWTRSEEIIQLNILFFSHTIQDYLTDTGVTIDCPRRIDYIDG